MIPASILQQQNETDGRRKRKDAISLNIFASNSTQIMVTKYEIFITHLSFFFDDFLKEKKSP